MVLSMTLARSARLTKVLVILFAVASVLGSFASAQGKEKVLYSFCSVDGCADGFSPARGPLAMGANGDLYGTTESGGGSQTCNGGCGVVFMLDSAGKETVLHSFSGGADGATPFGGLTIDSASNLYGAATIGGDLKCADDLSGDGCGVVFKMTP